MSEQSTRAPPRTTSTTGEYAPAYLNHQPDSGDPRDIRCSTCHCRITRIAGLPADGTARVGPCGHRIPLEVTV